MGPDRARRAEPGLSRVVRARRLLAQLLLGNGVLLPRLPPVEQTRQLVTDGKEQETDANKQHVLHGASR
jgi:hypothetical protein